MGNFKLSFEVVKENPKKPKYQFVNYYEYL